MRRRPFQRFMPDPSLLRQHKSLRVLGRWIDLPALWQINRHTVARAMGVGMFAALMPIPLQMLLAAVLAIGARANLAISVSLVWLTNPLTMPVVFYCTYQLGTWLLRTPARELPESLTWEWINGQLATLWQPFLLGSLVMGVLLGAMAYFTTLLYWRWWVARRWRRRQARDKA
jgi:uncharacterized protein (DUF2062 family)